MSIMDERQAYCKDRELDPRKTRFDGELFRKTKKQLTSAAKAKSIDYTPFFLYTILDFGQDVGLVQDDSDLSIEVILGLRLAFSHLIHSAYLKNFLVFNYEATKHDRRRLFTIGRVIIAIRKVLQIQDNTPLFLFLHVDEIQRIFDCHWRGAPEGHIVEPMLGLGLEGARPMNGILLFQEMMRCLGSFMSGACYDIFEHFANQAGIPSSRWMPNVAIFHLISSTGGLSQAVQLLPESAIEIGGRATTLAGQVLVFILIISDMRSLQNWIQNRDWAFFERFIAEFEEMRANIPIVDQRHKVTLGTPETLSIRIKLGAYLKNILEFYYEATKHDRGRPFAISRVIIAILDRPFCRDRRDHLDDTARMAPDGHIVEPMLSLGLEGSRPMLSEGDVDKPTVPTVSHTLTLTEDVHKPVPHLSAHTVLRLTEDDVDPSLARHPVIPKVEPKDVSNSTLKIASAPRPMIPSQPVQGKDIKLSMPTIPEVHIPHVHLPHVHLPKVKKPKMRKSKVPKVKMPKFAKMSPIHMPTLARKRNVELVPVSGIRVVSVEPTASGFTKAIAPIVTDIVNVPVIVATPLPAMSRRIGHPRNLMRKSKHNRMSSKFFEQLVRAKSSKGLVVVVIDLGDGAVVSLWEIQTQSDVGFGFGAGEHVSANVASIEPDADLLNALFLDGCVVAFVVSQGAPIKLVLFVNKAGHRRIPGGSGEPGEAGVARDSGLVTQDFVDTTKENPLCWSTAVVGVPSTCSQLSSQPLNV
ncbi:MAG: hypothetical protein J3Q66DRAFT_443600 [Benniella sp.]|nr:MAG: hypothetical protein J3Q66DRAFT_443600 [Benniella sp.]